MNFVVRKKNALIPVTGGVGLELLDEEADVAGIMRHFYRSGCRGVFVDIGANLGVVMLAVCRS